MLIIVNAPNDVANESHRSRTENVDVDINDTIETVKVKVSLVFTNLDPEKFELDLQGYRCRSHETILMLKKQFPMETLNFSIRTVSGCCMVM